MKPTFYFNYLAAALPTLVAIAGNLLGGWWSVSNIVFSLGVMVVVDWLAPHNKKPMAQPTSPVVPNRVLQLSVVFHTAAVASFVYAVHTGILQGGYIWWAAVGTGFSGGILGITAAHELIHRKEKFMQNLGIWNLFLVNYGHFFTEHRFVHHLKVGTPEDPATARRGESFYAFLVRTVPQQLVSAIKTDAQRMRKRKKAPYGWHNFSLRVVVLELAFMGVLALVFSPLVAAAYAVQSFAAFFLLEYVNYIEHYGLERRKGQKVGKAHAWQSDAASSRFTLFELSRHADHHMLAYKPYHTLDSHPESPELPAGYFGMFYVALVPPLWFNIMHKRIDRYKAKAEQAAAA